MNDSIMYTCQKCEKCYAIPYDTAPLAVREGKPIEHPGCGGVMHIGRPAPQFALGFAFTLANQPKDDGYDRDEEERDADLQKLEDEDKLPKGYVRFNYSRRENRPQEEIARLYGVHQSTVSRVLSRGDAYLKRLLAK